MIMEKICVKCLHVLQKNKKTCPICHTKQPINKKKIIRITTAFICLCLLCSTSFLFFSLQRANYSKENVMSQFEKAISERDERTLQKLLIHEDQTKVQAHEAKALIQLISTLGEVQTVALFRPIKTNSHIKPYRVTAPSVSLIKKRRNMSYAFHQVKEPLIPGVYPVRVTMLSDSFPSSTVVSVPLSSPDTIPEITETTVSFKFNSIFESILPFITVKKQNVQTSLSHLMMNSPISVYAQEPFRVEYTFHAPWGDLHQKESSIEQFTDFINLRFLTVKQQKQLEATLKKALLKDEQAFTTMSFKKKMNRIPIINEDFSLISVIPALNKKNELNGVIAQYYVNDAKKTHLTAHFLFKSSKHHFELHNLSYYQNNHAVFESDEKANKWMRYLTLNPLYLSQEDLKALFNMHLQNALFAEISSEYAYLFNYPQQKIKSIDVKNENRVILHLSSYNLQLKVDLKKRDYSWEVAEIVKE